MPEFGAYPEKASPAEGDFLLVLDGDDAATKKVDVGNLPGGTSSTASSRLWARAVASQDIDDSYALLSWEFPDVGSLYGAFGDDLQFDPEDDTAVQILTPGVYSMFVSLSITASDLDYAFFNLNIDPATGFEIPFARSGVAGQYFGDVDLFVATTSWTNYFSDSGQTNVDMYAYTNTGTWTFLGGELRIQRVA